MYGLKFSNRVPARASAGIMGLALFVAIVFGSLSNFDDGWISRVDNFFIDTLLTWRATDASAIHTRVIDIDDASMDAFGQWPWPRYRIAALIEAIADKHPAAIGVDVLFPEPDRSSLTNVKKAFKDDFNVDIGFSGAPAGLTDNDGYLGAVLRTTGAVGAKYLFFDHTTNGEGDGEISPRLAGSTAGLSLAEAPGVLNNTEALSKQIAHSGFINNEIDVDGRLRRIPLLIRHQGMVHLHLALATLMRALDEDNCSIVWDRYGPLIQVGKHRIPIDEKGFAILRFTGSSSSYPSLSALDIFNGDYRDAEIRGKAIFVGSSAAGLNDLHNTAVDPLFPGLKILSAFVEAVESGRFLRKPVWSHKMTLALCLGTGAIMATLFIALSSAWAVVAGTAALAGLLLFSSLSALIYEDVIISPVASLSVAATLFVIFLLFRMVLEKRNAFLWFKKLENSRRVTIESMAAVAETRDPETGAHIKRTQHYVKAIAQELLRAGQYTDILNAEYIDLLFVSAPLHDIGKVGVPDHILLKPGRLTVEEFALMKRHAEFGRSIVANTAQLIEGDNFMVLAGEIAATHHEKWDGSGYPLGLAGEDIPLSGRIMSVADVYDALISRRCYKEPFSHERATELLRAERGKSFDPVVLDAFFSIEHTILEIASTYRDEPDDDPVRDGYGLREACL